LGPVIHDVKTQALLQFGFIRASDPVIDYVQSHSLSRVFQFDDDFPGLSMLVCIDDCFARDAIQVRCGHVVVDSK